MDVDGRSRQQHPGGSPGGMARGGPYGAQSSGGGHGCTLNAVSGAILPACSGWWPAGSSVTQRLVGASQWPSAPPTARKTRVTMPGHEGQGWGSFQELAALTLFSAALGHPVTQCQMHTVVPPGLREQMCRAGGGGAVFECMRPPGWCPRPEPLCPHPIPSRATAPPLSAHPAPWWGPLEAHSTHSTPSRKPDLSGTAQCPLGARLPQVENHM